MKIKRVEIQAFKSYMHRKDGTFDFMVNTPSGEKKPANLISIYAPNGFGKTAFYDAVEYCITNNISRYIRGRRVRQLNEKVGKNNNLKGKKQYILRNQNADSFDPVLDTVIEIETTGELYRSQYSKPRKNSMDYKFDLSNTLSDRKFFRDVMLTQEAIDAFLREDSPTDKYEKFIENQVSDLTDIDNNRQKINRMLEEISRDSRELNKKLEGITSELKKIDAQKGVFTEANALIEKFDALDYDLPYIENPFSEVKKQQIDDRIRSVKASINDKVTGQESLEQSIKHFIDNLSVYRECFSGKKRLENELKNLSSTIKNKQEVEKIYLQVKGHFRNKEVLSNELKKLSDFLNQLPGFMAHKAELEELKNLILKQESNLSEATMASDSSSTVLKSSDQEQENLIAEEQKLIKLQTNSSHVYQKIYDLQRKVDEQEKLTADEVKKQIGLEYEIGLINTRIKQIKPLEITQRIPGHVVFDLRDDLNSLHEEFLKEVDVLTALNNKNTKIEGDLSNIQQQSFSLAELIRQGAKIVMQTKQSDCPLCQKSYPNFEQLKEQIENNPALKNAEKTLLQEKNDLELLIVVSKKSLEKLKQDYKAQLKEALGGLSEQLNEKQRLLANSHSEKQNLELSVEKDNQELATLSEITLFKKEDELSSYLQKEIPLILEKIKQCKLDIQNAKDGVARSDETKKEIEKALALLLTKQQSLIEDVQFLTIKKFLALKLISDTSSIDEIREVLLTLQQNSQGELDNKIEVIQGLEIRINELKNLIPIEYHGDSIVEISDMKDANRAKITKLLPMLSVHKKVVLYLKVEDLIDAEDGSVIKDQAIKSLKQVSESIEIKKQQLMDLDLLFQFSEGALNFSNKLELQEKESQVNAKIKGLSDISNDLSRDLSNISKYLKSSIKQYFHTTLINQIYASIDPHPEFKEIQFDCEIPSAGGKPELHIKLRNPEDGSIIQPTLHFSSAQINILSLSIFLAKALNVKDHEGKSVDCIFIDDPVQSMDSINALGLIDLFRNLSSKFDKQLIISTHDENFHELLKKKMPTDVFLSKYLALESFGKVVVQQ